jgi:hypothetical protein
MQTTCNRKPNTRQVGLALTLRFVLRRSSVSILAGIWLLWFSSVSPSECWNSTSIKSQPFPSKSFATHHSAITYLMLQLSILAESLKKPTYLSWLTRKKPQHMHIAAKCSNMLCSNVHSIRRWTL